MPYTPPSQRSPASSMTSSPILTRNHSYVDPSAPSSASSRRPSLPRSVSSTSYLNRSRRSPSFSTADNTVANGVAANGGVDIAMDALRARGRSAAATIRSSPPANPALMPPAAVTTPPDSSDDDGREHSLGHVQQLHDALQHIDLHRASSPVRDNPSPRRSLSAEARKISHSRSTSDMTLSQHLAHHPLHAEAIVSSSSSDGSEGEDEELRMKPLLLRKKSGELVKPALRPPSRRRPSSMPGTPTYAKAVHFNEDMEQVRHFLQLDRPIAVSAGSSPVETYDSETEYPFHDQPRTKTPEWEISLTNFPASDSYERRAALVRVERIFLTPDHQTLVGTIACANIAFQKLVVARFTLDYWKTTSEVVAEYNQDVRKQQTDDGCDRFNFNIKLADQANLESKTLLLCVRYSVNGCEHWDNNNGINYQVDFSKKTKQRDQKPSKGGLGAIPRSRHSPLAPRPRSMPASLDDDFGYGLDKQFHFGGSGGGGTGPRTLLFSSPNSAIKLKPKSKRAALSPEHGHRRSHSGQAFSSRYDFSASLSAALSTAQSTLGDRSGLTLNPSPTQPGYFDRSMPAPNGLFSAPSATANRPDSLSIEKPDLQSAEYNELIQKFCFFGTSSGKTSPSPLPHGADEAPANLPADRSGSLESSPSSSPSSPAMPLLVDGASDFSYSRSPSPFLNRSTSPGPVTGTGPEDHLAASYPYAYLSGMFNERSPPPTACV